MKITITIETDADPSTVLDLATEAAGALVQDLRDHDEAVEFDESDGVSVEG